MRKLFFCLLASVSFLLIAPPLTEAAAVRELAGNFDPADNGERLLALLVSITDPDFIELGMDELPDDTGRVRNISILVRGGALGGFRVEHLAAESSFVKLNPPSTWTIGNRHTFKVEQVLRSNFELFLHEQDMFDSLISYAPDDWSGIRVAFRPGRALATGNYRRGTSGPGILAEIETAFELENGKRVMLKDTVVRINGEDKTDLFRIDLEKLQPVLNLAVFPLPLTLSLLAVEDRRIVLTTRTRPRPVEEIIYRYVRCENNPFILERTKFSDYPLDQFQNGDLVFVNGKTWRTKIVNLLERSLDSFSHVGIVRLIDDRPYVVHASPDSETVQLVFIEDFLSPDQVDRAAVYRLESSPDIAEIASRKALEFYEKDIPFDNRFDIGNKSRLYCTELIWRSYKLAGIDLVGDNWDYLQNPILHGKLLLPHRLIQNPRLVEVFSMQ